MGRLTSVTDPTGTTTYAFDALTRVTGITAPQGSVGYTYNDADQRTSMTLPGGRTISYNYDATGCLANIGDWASGVINYSFDADGNLTGLSRSNGVNSAYGYDNAGRLTNISHNGPGGNLLFTNYTLDANGNRAAMASNAGTESYTLDVLNRLTNVSYPNGDTAAYSYDPNGNRLSQTFNGVATNYSYDNAGQLLSDGATSYNYDANGNLITAGADSYTWDWANRLTGATVGGNSASYSYDAFDVRVSGAVNGAATNYLWDRLVQNPLLVDDGGHAYVHGVGPQAQIDGSGNRHYLLSDALASIRGVTDGSGVLVGSTAYDAFGAVRSQTGSGSALGYTGELYTAATRLLHLRARDLNPALGRFLSADTVQPNAPGSQGFNLYAYVANNPTTWVDPSGHDVGEGVLQLPTLAPAVFRLASSLSLLISMTLAMGRNALFWMPGVNRYTASIGLAVFGLVLACGTTPRCMAGMAGIGNTMTQFGSDAVDGVMAWTAAMLHEATRIYPTLPTVAQPVADNGSALNNPLGPWLQACMLGGVLTGVANLTADAYGYQGTLGQNANIATNTMYNMITCGMMGGSGNNVGNNSNGGDDSLVTLYRAVRPEELDDVLRFGDYGLSPSGGGKYFALTEQGARDIMKAPMNRDVNMVLTKIEVPRSFVLEHGYLFTDPGQFGAKESVHFADDVLPDLYALVIGGLTIIAP